MFLEKLLQREIETIEKCPLCGGSVRINGYSHCLNLMYRCSLCETTFRDSTPMEDDLELAAERALKGDNYNS